MYSAGISFMLVPNKFGFLFQIISTTQVKIAKGISSMSTYYANHILSYLRSSCCIATLIIPRPLPKQRPQPSLF